MTYPRYLYDNEQETHRSEQTNPANLLAPLPYDFEEENTANSSKLYLSCNELPQSHRVTDGILSV